MCSVWHIDMNAFWVPCSSGCTCRTSCNCHFVHRLHCVSPMTCKRRQDFTSNQRERVEDYQHSTHWILLHNTLIHLHTTTDTQHHPFLFICYIDSSRNSLTTVPYCANTSYYPIVILQSCEHHEWCSHQIRFAGTLMS